MARLTEPRDYKTKGPVIILDIEGADNSTFFKGAMVVADPAGYIAIPPNQASYIPMGMVTGRQGQELVVPAGEHPVLEIESGLIWIHHPPASQDSVGKNFYLVDDGDVTTVRENRNWSVLCKGWKPGLVLLDFSAPMRVA